MLQTTRCVLLTLFHKTEVAFRSYALIQLASQRPESSEEKIQFFSEIRQWHVHQRGKSESHVLQQGSQTVGGCLK